jgi:hypothetical protein
MSLSIDTVTFDCADPLRLATFWAQVLEFEVGDVEPDGAFVRDPSGRTQGLFFQKVPESKTAKDRIHLDVRPTGSMAAEVARVKELGAAEQQRVDVEDSFWTIMLDPEGHEFCVLRGPEDGWSGEL